jgi:fumarate reductase flavoprotein subunit
MFGPMSEPVDKLEESVQKKLAFKGNTIEELAQAMDVPASELKVTVARYNEMAKKRIDKEYGKDPSLMFSIEKAPYYAVSVPAHLLVIVGGLNVNDRQQVLDKEDNEIPGLFAVGNVAGNLFANDYPLTVPGLSHGRCLTLGACSEKLGSQ